ncbi:MAG: transglycosylase SLT domain-containing protein [Nitrospinales bacterium]
MKFRGNLIPFLTLLLWLPVSTGQTKNLDIFKSGKAFPVDFVYLPERIVNLETLTPEQIPKVLKQYLHAERKVKGREKRNLHNLAIAFLYFKNADYDKAIGYLRNKIIGNFILDDFKIHFHAAALKELARQKLAEKKNIPAIGYLRQSIDLRLKLYRSFPTSPFYFSLPRDLAETEKLLGDAHFNNLSYKAAWRAYRKALMRKFPDNHAHRLQVYLALAKTYESANNLREAVNIYTHLASNFDEPEAGAAAADFVKKYEKTIRKQKLNAEILLAAYSVREASTRGGESASDSARPGKKPTAKSYDNENTRKFYESLSRKDPEQAFAWALKVLRKYPGRKSTRSVVRDVNRLIVEYLRDHPWNTDIDGITSHYPAQILRDLAYNLWRNLNPDAAALLYKKLLHQYPLEVESCHKALFFLGRIYEDKKDYPQAVRFYGRLLREYDHGSYATAARFKISWIKRLEGRHAEAVKDFKDALEFYDSPRYRRLQNAFPNAPSYLAATRYWLAQTAGALGNAEEKTSQLKTLIKESPFNFYAVISRGALGMPLKEFFNEQWRQPLADRMIGLGELPRKRLKRAEQLVAAGFLDFGKQELSQVAGRGTENLPFLFYLSRLFYLAGEYQQSIRLSWKLVSQDKTDFISSDVAKNLFPKAYLNQVESLARKAGLNSMLILSLIRQESSFNPGIVSSANAVGLMQLMPATARQVARQMKQKSPDYEALKNPQVNLPLGIDYLRRLLSSFENNIIYALAAYNAGPQKVREWIAVRSDLTPLEFVESIPYNETRGYVKKVLRNYWVYLSLYKNREIRDIKEILTISGD